MPHSTLKLIPGVDTNKTPTLNEAAISSCNLIRFIPDRNNLGLPQKLGGWTQFVPNWSSSTTIRALWAWEDTNNQQHLAIGTESDLYQTTGNPPGPPVDISPQTYTANITPSFTTTIGSSLVVIDDVGSNITDLDSVFISTQVSVGGVVLYGLYPCIYIGANSYEIVATDTLGRPISATAAVVAGGAMPVFNTTAGSSTISVTLADHGLAVGDTFPVYASTLVSDITLRGNYVVDSVTSSSVFTISAGNAASTTTSQTLNYGKAQLIYFIGTGALPTSTGYGVGGYGSGGYGTGVSVSSGRKITTTGASGTGSLATLNFTGPWSLAPGTEIVVSGVTPAAYNGTHTIVSSTSTSVTFASTATGPQTAAGTITVVYWQYPTTQDWTLDNWGETLIACPFNGAIFSWQPESGILNASIIEGAPVTNHGALVAMPQRQIIAWGSTFNGIHDPMLLRWCDVNDYNSWIGLITNQAGSYRIPKGSKIVGCIQAPQQTLVWTDLGVWSMQYVGQPYVYQFNEIGNGCGLIGPKAATSINGTVYWMGQSQFYRLAGGGVEPVRCPIWDVIFQDIDMSNTAKIRVAANSRFGEISWFYPTTPTGEVTRYVKYNILLDQWDFGVLSRTAWINESVYGPPIGAAFDVNSNYVFQHETSKNANGVPMVSSFKTGYFALSDGDQKIFVDEIWPDMKWGDYGGMQNANVSITFYGADFPGQTPTQYGPYQVTQQTTFVNPRIRARLLSIEVGSSDADSFWRLGGIRYRSQPDGRY